MMLYIRWGQALIAVTELRGVGVGCASGVGENV